MAALSDNHGETSVRRFPKWNRGMMENESPNMLVDYCWSLIQETPTGKYKKQKKVK
jgi:hypothetical protein